MERSPASGRFEELLAHRAWVRRVARALVLDESRADDLEQEVWLRALRAEKPRSPRAWLGTVLRRMASNARRDEGRDRVHERMAAPPEPLPDPRERIERAEVIERVARAVRTLDEPYGTAIFLRYFEDLAPPEIASRLGVPLETVRTRLRRGLAILRERLDAEDRGDRGKWALLLLPLVRKTVPGPPEAVAGGSALATAAGVLAMGTKSKVAIAAALLLLLGGGAWLLQSGPEVGADGKGDPEVAATPVKGNRGGGAAEPEAAATPKESVPTLAPEGAAAERILAGKGAALRAEIVDARTGAACEATRVEVTAVAPVSLGPRWLPVTLLPGLATAEGLRPGRWRIRAVVPAHADALQEFAVKEGETEVSVRVEVASTGAVSGSVDREKVPWVADLLVQVFRLTDPVDFSTPRGPEIGFDRVADTNVSADKGFTFKDLEPGAYAIRVAGYEAVQWPKIGRMAVGRAVLQVRPGANTSAVIQLRPAARVWLQWEGPFPGQVVELWIAEGDGPFEKACRCGGGGEGLNRVGPHFVAAGNLRWRARFLAWPLTSEEKELAEPVEGTLTLAEGEEAKVDLRGAK